MCGRFTLRTPTHLLVKQFQLDDVPDLAPRYNIAPTQDVAAVRLRPDTQQRELSLLRWGLVPVWADDPKIGYSTINARAETVATKSLSRISARLYPLRQYGPLESWQRASRCPSAGLW